MSKVSKVQETLFVMEACMVFRYCHYFREYGGLFYKTAIDVIIIKISLKIHKIRNT